MSFPKLNFIQEARELEVEALDGGRSLDEFTLAPSEITDDEECEVLGRPVDDIVELEERLALIPQYLEHARSAFSQRGLVYPFQASADGSFLTILPGCERLAERTAYFSSIVSQGNPVAKEFESSAFSALHALVGGWGVCLGSPRSDHTGSLAAVKRFRDLLRPWEGAGSHWPPDGPGDLGADGFIILGRAWGGPLVFFQAKNTPFDLKEFPEELGRMGDILLDWFGDRLSRSRYVVPVCALNTILTLEQKAMVFDARSPSASYHLLDATDILAAEYCEAVHELRRADSHVF